MNNTKIVVIGLGYVGLPLARLFATQYPVAGFDISESRVAGLNSGTDSTLEVSDELLQSVLEKNNPFAEKKPAYYVPTKLVDITNTTVYVMTVPTPVGRSNRPDLTPLIKPSETVGKVLNQGDIVIYDPWANPIEVQQEHGIPSPQQLPTRKYDALVPTVAHKGFLDITLNNVKAEQCFVYDVKGVLADMDKRL